MPIPIFPRTKRIRSCTATTAGGAIGLPIKKDKLFFYGSYQYTHASDEEIGISRAFVPLGLGCRRRSQWCIVHRPLGQLPGDARQRRY